jgi:tRNA 2-thiouridine synthesizing protein E
VDNYNTDSEGFLLDYKDWDMCFCEHTADIESIQMNNEHIIVINFLRKYFEQNKKSPAIRQLVTSLKKEHGENIGNSLKLQMLFPTSPAVQAAKLAGLPKPKRCI